MTRHAHELDHACSDNSETFPMPIDVFDSPALLGEQLAEQILASAQKNFCLSHDFLLGCPGGRSLSSTYQALGSLTAKKNVDLSHLVIVMMDEYVFPHPSGFTYCADDAHFSCRRFAREEIADVLNAQLPIERQVPGKNLWFPDPSDPSSYDQRIRDAGGIDLFLLAAGTSDGHVAFNPPGSEAQSKTRITALPESTRTDNLGTFPAFKGLHEVPCHGVTVGLGTIAAQSKAAVMVLHGSHKHATYSRLRASRSFDPSFPASIIFNCRSARLLVDSAAFKPLELIT